MELGKLIQTSCQKRPKIIPSGEGLEKKNHPRLQKPTRRATGHTHARLAALRAAQPRRNNGHGDGPLPQQRRRRHSPAPRARGLGLGAVLRVPALAVEDAAPIGLPRGRLLAGAVRDDGGGRVEAARRRRGRVLRRNPARQEFRPRLLQGRPGRRRPGPRDSPSPHSFVIPFAPAFCCAQPLGE